MVEGCVAGLLHQVNGSRAQSHRERDRQQGDRQGRRGQQDRRRSTDGRRFKFVILYVADDFSERGRQREFLFFVVIVFIMTVMLVSFMVVIMVAVFAMLVVELRSVFMMFMRMTGGIVL